MLTMPKLRERENEYKLIDDKTFKKSERGMGDHPTQLCAQVIFTPSWGVGTREGIDVGMRVGVGEGRGVG